MNTTPKRYELIKDIDSPELKCSAGLIGELDTVTGRVWFGKDKRFYYWRWQVENNPTWFREIKENKEWEIVAYKNKHSGNIDDYHGDTWRRADIDHHPIHSVKRLSDGEVFSVGDEVSWGKDPDYRDKIKSFNVAGGVLFFSSKYIEDVDLIDGAFMLRKIMEVKQFVWTDELVREYHIWCGGQYPPSFSMRETNPTWLIEPFKIKKSNNE